MGFLSRYEELIKKHVDAEFMEDGFQGSQQDASDVFLSKSYYPVYIPEYNILFVFRAISSEQEKYFPRTVDAEILMMGKTESLGLIKAIQVLENTIFCCYPWVRVWARSKSKTLARLYEKMGMKFMYEKDGYFFYVWER